jgi:nucleoside-diphosphate-sugar epimerase
MHALVTGGGGFLGRAITEQLLNRGDTVTILSRSRYPEVEALGAKGVQCDLSAPDESLARVLADIDVVFHVASKTGVWGPRETFFRSNVEGTRNLVAAAKAAGIRRFVYTSSPSATFDGGDAEGKTEAEAPYPAHFEAPYPESKAVAEKLVLDANSDDFATTALRPHLIWGPRDPHILPRLITRHKQGRLMRIGDGRNKVGITFIDNAAVAHVQAADALEPGAAHAGKPYFITDLEPVTLWPWINGFLTGVGLPPIRRSVSAGFAKLAGGVLEWVWRTFNRPGEPPMTRFVAAEMATSHWYDLTAARTDFGYTPLVGPEEGLERAISWAKGELEAGRL